MANIKISELNSAAGVTADDLFVIVDDPGGTPATVRATATQLKSFAAGTDHTAAVFVSKVGSDSSDGLLPADAKLTIGSAVTAASTLISGGAPRVAIHVLDGGTYTENVTLAAGMTLFAPAATLVGALQLPSITSCYLHAHYTASNNQVAVLKTGGTGQGFYYCDILDTRGTGGTLTGCQGLRNISNGSVLFARIGVLYTCESGTGIGDSGAGFGHIHFWAPDLYLAGDNAVGISAASNSTNIIGYIDHILVTGGATSTTAISVSNAGAIVKATITEIIATTAYNISAGALHLVCTRLSGQRTGTPEMEVSDQAIVLDNASLYSAGTPAASTGAVAIVLAGTTYYLQASTSPPA